VWMSLSKHASSIGLLTVRMSPGLIVYLLTVVENLEVVDETFEATLPFEAFSQRKLSRSRAIGFADDTVQDEEVLTGGILNAIEHLSLAMPVGFEQ